MKAFVIIHNSVTLDGSLTGFMPDMELHYRLAGSFAPDASLVGSETVIRGQEMFGNGIPDEEEGDFHAPQRDRALPWWVLVDSGGRLKGMLHTCRRLEYCRDVIILVSESTSEDYLRHLDERNYKYIKTGGAKVDLRSALSRLFEEFGIKKVITDAGQVLGNVLLNEGLVDEVSLLVHPLIRGDGSYPMFGSALSDIRLRLLKSEHFENGCVWLTYGTQTATRGIS